MTQDLNKTKGSIWIKFHILCPNPYCRQEYDEYWDHEWFNKFFTGDLNKEYEVECESCNKKMKIDFKHNIKRQHGRKS